MPKNTVFVGQNGLQEYLSPKSIGITPIVELPKELNPYLENGIHIYIKVLSALPLSNIKSIPSWNMLYRMDNETKAKTRRLVEYSSGNVALSLTILSRLHGLESMHAIIAEDVPEHKQRLLKLVGTKLHYTQGSGTPDVFAQSGGVYEATIMGKKLGFHNLHQYINKAVPEASKEYIAKQIHKQLKNKITAVCASIGTSGTIYGIGSYFKNKFPAVKVIGSTIQRGSSIPGPRGEDAVDLLAFPWKKVVDMTIPIDTISAYKESLALIRHGLFVGPSTGMQLAAVKKYCKKLLKDKKKLKREEHIVFLGCDTMFPYIDDYFSVLAPGYFK